MRSDAVRSKILPWLLTAVLLAGAWVIVKATLPVDAAQEPFVTTATLGEAASARNLVTTVTDVHAARSVTDATGWSADGDWLVIDLEAAAQVTQEGASLRTATLVIGDRTFTATERGTTFLNQALVTGVPRSGSLAFQLPDDAWTEHATLRLGLGTPVLDGVIEMGIDLSDLPFEPEVSFEENGWAR